MNDEEENMLKATKEVIAKGNAILQQLGPLTTEQMAALAAAISNRLVITMTGAASISTGMEPEKALAEISRRAAYFNELIRDVFRTPAQEPLLWDLRLLMAMETMAYISLRAKPKEAAKPVAA